MMFLERLEKIMEEVPVLLVDGILFSDKLNQYISKGVAVKNHKTGLRYTVLDVSCDDLANTLLHESLHHYLPNQKEESIEELTAQFWDDEYYRNRARNRLIDVLSGYNL